MTDTGCHPLGFTPPKESEWNSPSPEANSRNSSPKIRDLDWANSNLYQLVKHISSLPDEQNKQQLTKQIEYEFLNPEKLDIYTEDEAKYQSSLLKKRNQSIDDNYDEMMYVMFYKAQRTVEILSDVLLLKTNQQNNYFSEINMKSTMKMLLRSYKLHQSMSQMKKILNMVLK